MTTQDFLKTLKTAKRAIPSSISSSPKYEHTPIKTLINSVFNTSSSPTSTASTHNSISSFLSSLSSHQLQSFLSDPNIKTYDCLRIFNIVLHNQSELSFKPDVHAHFTIICRLIKSKMFSDAELLLEKLILSPNYRCPFSDFISWLENYCKESRIVTKLLNMLLKMYSDHEMFDMAISTFEYMVQKEIERDERTCSVHLYALTKSDKVDLAFEFFRRMVDTGMEVSVYSLTILVSGLCQIGELKMARDLVEEMINKGVRQLLANEIHQQNSSLQLHLMAAQPHSKTLYFTYSINTTSLLIPPPPNWFAHLSLFGYFPSLTLLTI